MPAARILLYVASIAAVAVLVRSLVMAPIPTWAAIAAMIAYTTLITLGVLLLPLQMFLDAMVRGPAGARGVALTFDDGPSPKTTPQILELLEEHRAKGNFFVIAKKAEEHPDLIRRMQDAGHLVCFHSYAHDRLFSLRTPKTVRRDLERGLEVLEKILGERPLYFRPPIGHSSPRIAKVVKELELQTVAWSIRALDGTRGATKDKVLSRVLPKLEDGEIVMLHDAAEREDFKPASLEALPSILEEMKTRRLRAVRLDRWEDLDPEEPAK